MGFTSGFKEVLRKKFKKSLKQKRYHFKLLIDIILIIINHVGIKSNEDKQKRYHFRCKKDIFFV